MAHDSWVIKKRGQRWSKGVPVMSTQTWRGLTSEYASWFATQTSGYSLLNIDEELFADNGSGTVEGMVQVEIGYSITAPDGSGGGGGADGLLVREWDMPYADEEVHILEAENARKLRTVTEGGHPEWVANIVAYVSWYESARQRALRDGTVPPVWSPGSPDLVTSPPFGAVPAGFTPSGPMAALGIQLAEHIRDNPDDKVAISTPTLRKVETVLSVGTLVASHTNLNRAYDWAALVHEEPSVATAPYINTAELPNWYWVKGSAQLDRVSQGLRQITQVWRGVKAVDTFKYGEIITYP